MARKLREAEEASEIPNDPEIKAEKKKKKKNKNTDKNPNIEEQNERSPKRKLEESEPQGYIDCKERKKKKKKHLNEIQREEKEEEEEEPKRTVVSGGGKEEGSVKDGVVVVTGKDVEEAKYAALKSFKESKLPSEVLQCCKNFESPSQIQSRAWPFLLDGRDFIGIAATGSGEFFLLAFCVLEYVVLCLCEVKLNIFVLFGVLGKTLAFGVPAIMHILKKRKGKFSKGRNPLCLVLSPTRELAQQVCTRGSKIIYVTL